MLKSPVDGVAGHAVVAAAFGCDSQPNGSRMMALALYRFVTLF
jgi:hypothetical protein